MGIGGEFTVAFYTFCSKNSIFNGHKTFNSVLAQ